MSKWWHTNERRVVHSVRCVGDGVIQVVRKAPMAVEVAIIVDGQPVEAIPGAPAWLSASGRAASRVIYSLAAQQLECWRAEVAATR